MTWHTNFEAAQPVVVDIDVRIRHIVHFATGHNPICQLIVAHIQGSGLLKLCEGGWNGTREFIVG